jgi:hypothetical protein
MHKQILSLVCLTGFALLYTVARVVADPAEDSDRRFLNNLENGTAPQAAPANSSATTDAAPQKSSFGKTAKRNRKHQPAPGAQPAAAPSVAFGGEAAPANAPAAPNTVIQRHVTIIRTPVDDDHDRDHHHNFFHRLFGNLFKDASPDDW